MHGLSPAAAKINYKWGMSVFIQRSSPGIVEAKRLLEDAGYAAERIPGDEWED
jgi:hypothetical protein